MNNDINQSTNRATPRQLLALHKLGWQLRALVTVDCICTVRGSEQPGNFYSFPFKEYGEARDWAYRIARERQDNKCVIDFALLFINPDKLASQREEQRIIYERRYVEYGMHVHVDGPHDIQPEIPAGLNMGDLELIVAARLAETLGIGPDGKRVKKLSTKRVA